MLREATPSSIAPPAANYALGVVSSGVSRILHTSGIVGERPDGSISADVGEQADEIWKSLAAICGEAGMTIDDIVSITTYAVHGEVLGGVMAARDQALGGRRIASTLITVPALARPHWKVEITAVAMA